MRIAKYWARARLSVTSSSGQAYLLRPWRWSDVSIDDAQRAAEARVQDLAARLKAGEILNCYSYGERPLREPILRPITGRDGKELAVITRNSYGASVLNAAAAMFVDIDFPDPDAPHAVLGAAVQQLKGKPPRVQQEQALGELELWTSRNPSLALRVYRTYGGLRALVTNETFDPAQEGTVTLMRALNADPLYVTLCRQQQSFRARLTAKPWRAHLGQPPASYAFDDARAEQAYRTWDQKYQQVAVRYAVCEFLRQFGPAHVHPDIAPVLAAHDQATISDKPLQLA